MVLGIDIGATRTKVGVVDPSRLQLVWSSIVPTVSATSGEEFLTWLERCIRDSVRDRAIAGIGVGIAGFVTYDGLVVHSPNIPVIERLPLQAWLRERFPGHVYVDNDANVAAWAEYRAGAGQGVSELLYVTVGTGVGGGVILGGRIWRGTRGGAGEIGHMIVDITASGQTGMPLFRVGVLEEYVGQRALLRCAHSVVRRYPDSMLAGQEITIEALGQAYAAGDEAARECLSWAAWVLAAGIASAVALLDVEVVVLGGGLVEGLPGLLTLTQEAVRRRALPAVAQHIELRGARFGTWAGVIGAALLAWETAGGEAHA